MFNDRHAGDCGGHLSGYATGQKILYASYFWPTIFRDCILAVRICHACQIFYRKIYKPPAPMHLVVFARPFTKWGIDFMTCNPPSSGGRGYIIFSVDYFTEWAETMPTFNNTGQTTALFFFNHVIAWFGVPQAIVTDHEKHFHNHMMSELTTNLALSHDNSTPYYPQQMDKLRLLTKFLNECFNE